MSPRSLVGRLVGVTYGKSRLDGLECCEGFEVSGVAVADQGARFGSTVPEDFG
jgi:hypothetical protein